MQTRCRRTTETEPGRIWPRPMYSGPQGKSDPCVRRAYWTRDHCHRRAHPRAQSSSASHMIKDSTFLSMPSARLEWRMIQVSQRGNDHAQRAVTGRTRNAMAHDSPNRARASESVQGFEQHLFITLPLSYAPPKKQN